MTSGGSAGPDGGAGGAGPVEQVALFVTCVADLLEPDVAAATVRVLRATGAHVVVPDGQTCCGQPAWNAGHADEAAQVARTSLAALDVEPADVVVVPAGSCATMIRLYWPALFDVVGDAGAAARARAVAARVRELTEHLATVGVPDGARVAPRRVAYHRSCHMERELHLHDEPHAVLGAVDGVAVAPWAADDRCCGFGGTFSVRLPEVSEAMADDKLDSLPAGVTCIAGADASCLAQLRERARYRGMAVTTVHVAELVDRALSRAGDAT